MKALFHRIYANPRYAKVFHWGKLITITGSAQMMIQAIGLISGILIIRLLSPGEYALYILANTMLGTMVVLADGGIYIGVMSRAGRVWQDKHQLGSVLATGLDLRKKFAIGSLVVALPVLFYLLHYHGASWLFSSLIILALIPAFFTSLSGTLLEIVPKLRQNISPLQTIEVTTSVARLILLCLTLIVFPWAFVAILAASLPQLWANKRLFKISADHALISKQTDVVIRKEILDIVRRTLPGAIYYCLSGQITIWLISVFGTTASIAQIGALSRIAMVLTLFSVLFNTLVTPRFARLPNEGIILLNRFLQILVALLLLGVLILGVASVFSTQALWILGPNYSHLKTEFILSIVAGYCTFTVGILYTLITSRGWVVHPAISITVNLAAIICGAVFLNISSVKGIIILNIFVASIDIIILLLYGLIMIRKIKYDNLAVKKI